MKHSTRIITTLLFILWMNPVRSQDTFSIVAVDSITGEVGSAGASCVDLFAFPGYATDFLGDLIPGVGAINTQAYYLPTNQVNARNRMLAGDTPSQIIQWLVSNDAQSNPAIRQYGIAAFVIGVPQTAAHTGTGCQNYKDHITGSWYSIQGNILLGQQVLDSMESRLLNEPGDLACKLMAALQGANIPGADSRCLSDSTSSLFAFLKVSQPSDPYGSPSLLLSVKTHDNSGIEPIDTLQTLFNAVHGCAPSTLSESPQTQQALLFPNPAKQVVTVRLLQPSQSDGTYRIIDRMGRQTGVRGATRTEFQINCSDLKSGIYFLEINSGDNRFYKKLIID